MARRTATWPRRGNVNIGQLMPAGPGSGLAPKMIAANAEPDGLSILVEGSDAYVGDPSASWLVSILGVGDYTATGEVVPLELEG